MLTFLLSKVRVQKLAPRSLKDLKGKENKLIKYSFVNGINELFDRKSKMKTIEENKDENQKSGLSQVKQTMNVKKIFRSITIDYSKRDEKNKSKDLIYA